MALRFSAIDYGEVALDMYGSVGLQRRQHGINQIANRPYAISNPERDRWRGPQRLMDAAKIVVRHVQADRRSVIGEFL